MPFIREVGPKSDFLLSDVGFYEGTLSRFCELADSVVREMGSYDILAGNCQTFCNELLKKMDKPEFPTSTEFLDREFDLLHEALVRRSSNGTANHTSSSSAIESPSTHTCASEIEHWTRKLDDAVSSGVLPLSIDDFKSLNSTLALVSNHWREIGDKLFVNLQILQTIEKMYPTRSEHCMREMFREYLQQTDPPPSWRQLLHVLMEYDFNVAKSIIRKLQK